jgi:hypothetical protein
MCSPSTIAVPYQDLLKIIQVSEEYSYGWFYICYEESSPRGRTLSIHLLGANLLWNVATMRGRWGHKEDERQLSSFYINPSDTYQSTTAKSTALEGEF